MMASATLTDLLAERAQSSDQNTAISSPGRPGLSYRELFEHVDAMGRKFSRLGMTRTDRIAVVLPNGPEMATAFLATAAVGVCAPLNPGYQAAEFEFYLKDLNARAVVVRADVTSPVRAVAENLGIPILEIETSPDGPAGKFRLCGAASNDSATDTVRSLIPAQPDDVALVLHTSGTTSRPKIVPLTHRNLVRSARNTRRRYRSSRMTAV
ncbi:MAG: AMP-binding protein [Planctomycetota bacterium]|nr:AMP-binding protein [Planctomycetota bacterium]MDA1212137.1 AMP-binding protein [Planctomycetota bacterium]